MKTRTWTDEQLSTAVRDSWSIAGVIRKLNLAVAGGTYAHIQTHIKRLNLDTSHFTPSGIGKFGFHKNLTIEDILIENSLHQSCEVRKFLIREKLKDNICEICGIKDWQGQSITIELDHINGIRNDNRIENLRMLCPNCHSQQPTSGGKNKKR